MLKNDVGIRFKAFRANQKKPQHEMAAELKVHQSTITNIEHGTTFPKISYLYYFFENYGLNINWLITGEGEMYLHSRDAAGGAQPVTMPHIQYGDTHYDQYVELTQLMEVPVIEQVMLAKLAESKFIFKDEINAYMKKRKEVEEAAKLKAEEMLLEEKNNLKQKKAKKK